MPGVVVCGVYCSPSYRSSLPRTCRARRVCGAWRGAGAACSRPRASGCRVDQRRVRIRSLETRHTIHEAVFPEVPCHIHGIDALVYPHRATKPGAVPIGLLSRDARIWFPSPTTVTDVPDLPDNLFLLFGRHRYNHRLLFHSLPEHTCRLPPVQP